MHGRTDEQWGGSHLELLGKEFAGFDCDLCYKHRAGQPAVSLGSQLTFITDPSLGLIKV